MIIGLVGKPSAGKSTMFKAMTLANVAIGAYPFTTIHKNEGVGFVHVRCVDEDFRTQCNPREGFCRNHERFVPVRLIDVAGLVPEAHLGKGLGLQFLDDLRPAHVLIHVVDCSGSTNERGESVESGAHDPVLDVKFLEHELDMWYLSILKKGWEKSARTAQARKNIHELLEKQLSGLNVTEEMVKEELKRLALSPEMPAEWSDDDLFRLARALRVRTKPIVIAANKMDLPTSEGNFARLKAEFPTVMMVPCAADLELALREADQKGLIEYIPGQGSFKVVGNVSDRQRSALEYIQKNVLDRWGSTGVQAMLDRSVFDVLGFLAIFPGSVSQLGDKHGNILPDVFLMPKGSTALDFAFRIHSDLGTGFVKAIDVKSKRAVGKEHLLKHRDVVEIVAR